MHRALLCLGMTVWATGALCANPARESIGPGPVLDARQASNFAKQLAEITQFTAEQYIRSISRAELAEAALNGLYEAAGVPAPGDLHTEVAKAASSSEFELRKLFARIRQSLGNPPPLEGTGAIYASLQGLSKRLDPYSAVLRGAEARRIDPREASHGFGLELVDSSGAARLVIKSVAPGGPGQKAGLRPGDEITHMNGMPANTGIATPLALTKLDSIQVQVRRQRCIDPMKAALKAEIFTPEMILGVIRKPNNTWDFFLDREHRIAQIRIAGLDPGITDDLKMILDELREAGMRGLILDLRWCPGGYLDASRGVADLFMGRRSVTNYLQPAPATLLMASAALLGIAPRNATVHSRNDQLDTQAQHAPGEYTGFPMVILTNAETTGGAELVAAVLQDNRRAMVAGQRTRGKASVQRKWPLGGEADGLTLTVPIPDMELKLTNGLLERPSGKNLHRFPDSKPTDDWGVQPDPNLEFWVSAAMSRRLQEWWQLQNLRPGTENEALPLDDPAADPQRLAALRVLVEIIGK